MYTKSPKFQSGNYYWYRENGKLSIHLISEQVVQSLSGPQKLFVANNGGYLIAANSMKGDWWDTPIPLPSEEHNEHSDQEN